MCQQAAETCIPMCETNTTLLTPIIKRQCQALVNFNRRTNRGTIAEMLVQCINPSISADGLCIQHSTDVMCIRRDATAIVADESQSTPISIKSKAKPKPRKSRGAIITEPVTSSPRSMVLCVQHIQGVPFYVDCATKTVAYSTYDVLNERINPAIIGRFESGKWIWIS